MTTTTREPLTLAEVCEVSIYDLHETPENWTIYRQPDANDPAWNQLCESVSESGVKQPLEVSADNYIISGHRRYRAALHEGLDVVRVIFDHSILIGPMAPADRVKLLVERNKGTRVKTDSETYLEAAASVDPAEAIAAAQARKAKVFTKVKTSALEQVEITGKSRRTNPTRQRGALLEAVQTIIERLRQAGHLPTSSRHIHYQLLQMKVRTSAGKAGFIYGTQRPGKIKNTSDKLLSKLLTDARSDGLIDDDAINDETRQQYTFTPNGSVGAYVNKELDTLFRNYFSNVHADQPVHLELLIEKNTLAPLVWEHIARKFRLPLTALHGYGSYPASRDVAARFTASGKAKCIVLYISDLDPEGVNMPAAFKKYALEDFNMEATVIRVGVTREQVEKYDLLPDADAKPTSTRYKPFFAEYGDQCWELDSMPPDKLLCEIEHAVKQCLDLDAFNRAMKRKQEADVQLARLNAAVRAFVNENINTILPGGFTT